MKGVWVTGTGTGVGKTRLAQALLLALAKGGVKAAGVKPVATGAARPQEHEDALALFEASSIKLPWELVCPFCFALPQSPHLSAAKEGRGMDIALAARILARAGQETGFLVAEGIGGWLCPLSAKTTFADLAVAFPLPVVLVAGVRLGVFNDALLTAQAIARVPVPFLGWVANVLDPRLPLLEETLQSLEAMLPVPLLAKIAWQEPLEDTASGLYATKAWIK